MRGFFLIAATVFSASVFGQKWYAGPEIGANLISVQQSDLGTNFQLGFHGGGNIEYRFNNYFSLRAGVFATQKRQAYDSYDSTKINLFGLEDNLPVDVDGLNLYSYKEINGTVSQIYTEIPLMATYTYKHFSLFAGGYAAYMITTRKKEEELINTPLTRAFDIETILGGNDPTGGLAAALLPPGYERSFTESSSKSGFKAFDFGLKAGLRYEMDDFGLNLNYLYGLTGYQTKAASSESVNHHYFQLSLNYNFALRRK